MTPNTTKLGDKVRHVYYVGGSCPQSSLFTSKIRSFIFGPVQEIVVDKQINSWMCLRMLDLSSADITSLVDSICRLLHLRYLNLYNNIKLEAISDSITKLHNLQTLILSNCDKFRDLPKDFSKLVKLRHFDISYCLQLSSMPSGMEKLTSLSVLPLFVVGKGKIVSSKQQYSGELKDLEALSLLKGGIQINIGINYSEVMNDKGGEYLKNKKHLTEVNIQFDRGVNGVRSLDDFEVLEKLEPHSNLKGLILNSYNGRKIPRWGRAEGNWSISFPNLVKIDLLYCPNLEHVPSMSKLPYLKLLQFGSLYKLEYLENRSSINNDREELSTFFPSLEHLCIHTLKSLKGWWRVEELVEDNDDHILRRGLIFPRLSKLEIHYCHNLSSFPSCPSLEEMDFSWNNKTLRVDCAGYSQDGVRGG